MSRRCGSGAEPTAAATDAANAAAATVILQRGAFIIPPMMRLSVDRECRPADENVRCSVAVAGGGGRDLLIAVPLTVRGHGELRHRSRGCRAFRQEDEVARAGPRGVPMLSHRVQRQPAERRLVLQPIRGDIRRIAAAVATHADPELLLTACHRLYRARGGAAAVHELAAGGARARRARPERAYRCGRSRLR